MPKLPKPSFWFFFKLILIIVFVVLIVSRRGTILDTYNRGADDQTELLIRKDKESKANYERFNEQSKNMFSNQVDGLIILIAGVLGMIILEQRKTIQQLKSNEKTTI